MKTRRLGIGQGERLKTGAAILAAAHVADTELVKPRLNGFAAAQRSYVEAQQQLEAADAQLRKAQVQLVLHDTEQDKAVERLARALVAGGQPRNNPFAAFGTPAPSAVKDMPPVAEAKEIHQLVAAVQRTKLVGRAALQAAQAAEQAAQRVEAALRIVGKCQETVGNTRRTRDDIGQIWDTTLAALKRGARAAADEGAPGLYTALFGRPSRSTKKTATTTPAPTPDPAPPVVPVVPVVPMAPVANAA